MHLPKTHTGPGLTDIQVNGYAGFDFNADPASWTPDLLRHVRNAARKRGVVRMLPTLITDRIDRMQARVERFHSITRADPDLRTFFPFLHIEGPFVSSTEGPRGAHPKAHCTTPEQHPDFFDRLIDISEGRVRLATLAPELPGALDLITTLREKDITVSIAHTKASTKILQEAVERGVRLSTHLGNGSHQTLPRLDNYVQTQLADDALWASFLADGHHIPFGTLKNFIRAKTPGRSILTTDAIAAAEQGPGEYRLGDEKVIVTDKLRVSKPGEWNLAGSALTLDRAVLNTARHCKLTLGQAWQMASTHPSQLLGLDPAPTVQVEITPDGFVRREILD